jgi:hypothetical protein
VDNLGSDRFVVRVTTLVVAGRLPGTSLGFSTDAGDKEIVTAYLGTLGPSLSTSNDHSIVRLASGTARRQSLRTIAEFASDAELDPLDTEPTLPYRCMCTMDVAIL